MTLYGYAGKILEVDLAARTHTVRDLDPDLANRFIGGTGLGAYLLYQEGTYAVDPLGPDNTLIFGTGPFAGTSVPLSNRYGVCARSPLTGVFGESECGGHWANDLKRAGYDLLIVRGKADRPVYLWIHDDEVEFRDASHLWGKDTFETHDQLREEVGQVGRSGQEARIICIGPAGERLVRYAAITNDGADGRAAWRREPLRRSDGGVDPDRPLLLRQLHHRLRPGGAREGGAVCRHRAGRHRVRDDVAQRGQPPARRPGGSPEAQRAVQPPRDGHHLRRRHARLRAGGVRARADRQGRHRRDRPDVGQRPGAGGGDAPRRDARGQVRQPARRGHPARRRGDWRRGVRGPRPRAGRSGARSARVLRQRRRLRHFRPWRLPSVVVRPRLPARGEPARARLPRAGESAGCRAHPAACAGRPEPDGPVRQLEDLQVHPVRRG